MKKTVLSILGLLLSFTFTFAQSISVNGKVTAASDGLPLPGVSVSVKGNSNVGTQTDADGFFKMTVSADSKTLVFKYIGYKQKEVTISTGMMNIQMEEDQKQLSEVVVVGYGTQTRASVTGSITKIGGDKLQNVAVPSFESAIQGRAAGVFIEAQNGKLGQAIKVRVRGSSSVSAGNEPLYVVDGIPITTNDFSNNGGSTNPLTDLSQNDIESIEILKDASAASIYGSRASNGVVLITTKSGKAGKTNISLNYYSGFSKASNQREFLNAQEYVEYSREAGIRGAKYDYRVNKDFYDGQGITEADLIADNGSFVERRLTRYSAGNTDYQTYKVNTNWQDQVFRSAPVQNYNLVANGGNEKTKFYISGTYNDQEGFLIRNSINQYSGRINLENKATDRLTLGFKLALSRTENKRLSGDNAFSTPVQIVALSPITPIIDPRSGLISGALDVVSGVPNTNFPVYYNPMLSADNAFYNTLVYRNLGNVYASYNFIKGLTFRSEFGVDLLNQNEEGYYGKLTVRNLGTANGFGLNYNTQALNFNANNFIQFNREIGKSFFDVVLGTSFQKQTITENQTEGQQFPSDAFKKVTSSAEIINGSSTGTAYSLLSYFSRVNYRFNERYLVSLSGRLDGSSRFGNNSRYGFFPAGSVGWIISEEEFMKSQDILSLLKLRASYGVTGNSEIGNFGSRKLYSAFSYAGTAGSRPSQFGNPDLKWETTNQLNLGLEFGILNNRISGELDIYQKKTKDLLLNVQVPASTGFTTVTQNLGKLENKGIEFSVNTQNLVGKFNWSSNVNFSINRNKITDLKGQIITGSGDAVNRATEGQPIGIFFTKEFAGADPANGDAVFFKNTLNADKTRDRSLTSDYNAAENVVVGNPNPKWSAGLSNTFTFKGIDLSVLIQGVYGNDIYNGGGQYMSASGSNGFDNQTRDQLNSWKKPGDITMVPEARLFLANGINPSSRFLADGSYARLKNVTLGYNLPQSLLSKIKLQSLRVYAIGQNLFTVTNYDGWDPEVNSDDFAGNITQGYDFYAAPQARTITFGINVGF